MSKEKITEEVVEEVKDEVTEEVVEEPKKKLPVKRIVIAVAKFVAGFTLLGFGAKMAYDIIGGIKAGADDEVEDDDTEDSDEELDA